MAKHKSIYYAKKKINFPSTYINLEKYVVKTQGRVSLLLLYKMFKELRAAIAQYQFILSH